MNSNEIFVSLDIGTSNVKVIIGEMVNENLNIIGVGNVKSDGLRKGSIVDIDETVQSIRKAIEEAQRMVGIKIDRVIVGISSNGVQLVPCKGVVAVSNENREIGNNDVQRVIEASQLVAIPPEREIIDVVPTEFIVDGLDEIKDPRGMIGVRLEMEGILVTGAKTLMHNLLRCVERAGLEITDICLQPLAAGSLALSKDEINRGVVLVDIGGGSTTLSIFKEGMLKTTNVLPIGGQHITRDISIGLQTSSDDAEKIKVKYGHAFYDTASEEELFSVPIMGSDQHEQYTQVDLSEITEARLEEILDFVKLELRRLGVRDLPGGFVLTGGVMKMPGVLELAQHVLKHNVRIAYPDYIGVREPQYTTGVGLIKYAYKKSKLRGKVHTTNVQEDVTERPIHQKPKAKPKQVSKPRAKDDEKMGKKMKKFFRYLWE
ncbi:cell division protein FtsA [Priestia taiwanensis]|uniref:Cell division protein FtsA n=1 Tax=Priestia taiwanensis TaxID=1347902 RepID=A0A917AQY8_9BACI|nr:cell division protein FtsA [Priestia taiwanensis]MBM7362932.1 cell division protein FtsA [Priestia taiwanensis]GGE66266.1 cell division protein FtsA [Priestia taiwanensis]